MATPSTPDPLLAKPLGDLVEAPKTNAADNAVKALDARGRVWAAPFASLRTADQLDNALYAGAAAPVALAIVHGVFCVLRLDEAAWRSAGLHGLLTLAAVLAGYLIVRGRAVWPSLAVLAWLAAEIALAPWLLGYRWGTNIFNIICLPLAILAVRASLRRARAS